MIKRSVAIVVSLFLSLLLSAAVFGQQRQTRTRVPKPKPQPGSPSPKVQEQELWSIPDEYVPAVDGSFKKCPLTWQQAPTLGNFGIGMTREEVSAIARGAIFRLMADPGLDWGKYLEYYQSTHSVLEKPLPSPQDLFPDEMLEPEERRAKQKRNSTPKPNVGDDVTKLQEIKFGFSEDRLIHLRARYFSTVNWTWTDLKDMLSNQGVPPNDWIRHTNMPMSEFQRQTIEMFGGRIHKYTIHCQGFTLTATINEPGNWFTLNIINLPSFVQAHQKFQERDANRKKVFKP